MKSGDRLSVIGNRLSVIGNRLLHRLPIAVYCLPFIIFLTACGQTSIRPLPTLIPVLFAPGETATPTAVSPLPVSQRVADGRVTDVSAGSGQAAPPTPAGDGVRPRDAEQKYLPDAGPEPPTNWRPPPYAVPLSFHPDDHYFLIRPIPSGKRNYDLEWYPFGNDVLAPGLLPYRVHHGMDFPNESGTPVLAASSGTVIHAGPLPSPRDGVNYYGNTVVILHDWQWQGQDVYTLYAHTLELFVQVGDHVPQGQLIAGVGSSGEVTGPHLHFEVRLGQNNYNTAVNPALWLAPYEGWGTIAGRFVDRRGRLVSSALLTLRPLPLLDDEQVREQRTYYYSGVASDPVWQENFVFGDVPAGQYELLIDLNDGIHRYRRMVTVYPGQTSFVLISDNFDFFPTATPIPTPLPTPSPLPIFIPPENPTPEG